MVLKELNYLLDAERELLLRKSTRVIDFPTHGKKTVETFTLVWSWYDRLLTRKRSVGEAKLLRTWEACMDEEQLSAPDALVRLTYVYVEGADRIGLDLLDDGIKLRVAKDRMTRWQTRKDQRASGNG